MPTKQGALTDSDRRNMRVVMDRLIPPVDDLPGAGTMGLLDEIERIASEHDRYRKSLVRFLDALTMDMSVEAEGGFLALSGEQQDEAIREIEESLSKEFANVLEVVYISYYSRPEVHARIGWRTGPLQPLGFTLPPFDESILDTVRKREPFWRQAPD
ncbi:MAG: gluconate 2-dehydrogenase subunit 3 family protein [Chloroflexi bacterium]|nr:gluconate 2-dehydrogenase subunit 3 family protein [Chloroflexota bacterium]MDA1296799.1 gluconate 2-dehydrogenase subunit 3 family protein [Chloroflexota bacterium]